MDPRALERIQNVYDTNVYKKYTMLLIAYGVLGRLLIWVLQTAEPFELIYSRHWFLQNLFECDFCLGFWVYSGLALLLDIRLLEAGPALLDYAVTGIATSFIVHLARLGWDTKFKEIRL